MDLFIYLFTALSKKISVQSFIKRKSSVFEPALFLQEPRPQYLNTTVPTQQIKSVLGRLCCKPVIKTVRGKLTAVEKQNSTWPSAMIYDTEIGSQAAIKV